MAFETIINAFNKGDKKTLKTLLTTSVYKSFETAIDSKKTEPDYQFYSLNIENIESSKIFKIGEKYQVLDKIFLRVLKGYPQRMPDIFFKMFGGSANSIIKFLSNKSNILEDLLIILKMPKWIFIKEIWGK